MYQLGREACMFLDDLIIHISSVMYSLRGNLLTYNVPHCKSGQSLVSCKTVNRCI